MSFAMRATRLLSLLLLLQSRGAMTGQQLAGCLEVSERTVQRDVGALGAVGIPIVSERGRAGGYRLPGGYRLRLTGLTHEEAGGLFLTGLPSAADDLGLASIVAAAQLKVLAALPWGLRQRAERAANLLHIDAPGWYQRAQATPHLPTLAAAVWQGRRVDARYRRSDGRIVSRVLNPLGLVLKGGAWYAVADAHRGRRVFRVSRFERVSMRAETFSRPSSFDLAAFWTEWSVSFEERLPQLEVTLRVRRDHLRYLRSAVAPSGQATIDAIDAGSDGGGDRVTVVVPFDGVGYAQSQLLGFGTAVEVLSPRDFRERLADTAHEIAAMYDGSTSDAN
jgi:predicted DNA-binding transcriptional regulator YafY